MKNKCKRNKSKKLKRNKSKKLKRNKSKRWRKDNDQTQEIKQNGKIKPGLD